MQSLPNQSPSITPQTMPSPPATDYPDLVFLATKSQDLINKQVESYRHQQSNSAIILTLLAVFLPFFLNGLTNSIFIIKVFSVVPTALIVWATLLFLRIFRSQPLDQAFSHTKFQTLINEPYEQILLYEIGANTDSFTHNSGITAEANARYNRALVLTVATVIASALLLMADKFFEAPKEIQEVHLTNSRMNQPATNTPAPAQTPPVTVTPAAPVRTLPTVPHHDRERLNEGVERENQHSKHERTSNN